MVVEGDTTMDDHVLLDGNTDFYSHQTEHGSPWPLAMTNHV